MKILVIEDNAAELAKAKEIIEAMGHEVEVCYPDKNFYHKFVNGMTAILYAIEATDGVITDLNFELPKGQSGITQSGLLVALHATSFGKPVVICTRFEEGDNHHGKAASWIYDGYFMELRLTEEATRPDIYSRCPGWVENKDWKQACEELEKKFAALPSKERD